MYVCMYVFDTLTRMHTWLRLHVHVHVYVYVYVYVGIPTYRCCLQNQLPDRSQGSYVYTSARETAIYAVASERSSLVDLRLPVSCTTSGSRPIGLTL